MNKLVITNLLIYFFLQYIIDWKIQFEIFTYISMGEKKN